MEIPNKIIYTGYAKDYEKMIPIIEHLDRKESITAEDALQLKLKPDHWGPAL